MLHNPSPLSPSISLSHGFRVGGVWLREGLWRVTVIVITALKRCRRSPLDLPTTESSSFLWHTEDTAWCNESRILPADIGFVSETDECPHVTLWAVLERSNIRVIANVGIRITRPVRIALVTGLNQRLPSLGMTCTCVMGVHDKRSADWRDFLILDSAWPLRPHIIRWSYSCNSEHLWSSLVDVRIRQRTV